MRFMIAENFILNFSGNRLQIKRAKSMRSLGRLIFQSCKNNFQIFISKNQIKIEEKQINCIVYMVWSLTTSN